MTTKNEQLKALMSLSKEEFHTTIETEFKPLHDKAFKYCIDMVQTLIQDDKILELAESFDTHFSEYGTPFSEEEKDQIQKLLALHEMTK